MGRLSRVPCTVHSISAKTSQGGIKCTKVPKVLLSKSVYCKSQHSWQKHTKQTDKEFIDRDKKNLLAMPSRADKGKCDICLQERHSSFCCTFCFYLRRRKKVLLKQNFRKFQPPITTYQETIYSFAFDKIKQEHFVNVTFAYKKDIHLFVPFAFTYNVEKIFCGNRISSTATKIKFLI